MNHLRQLLIITSYWLISLVPFPSFGQETDTKTLIVIFDGLRADYITPELMPNLYTLSQGGSVSKQHHSVFPTVTRVNSPSIFTGTYPHTHGILGNTIYVPDIKTARIINTSDAQELIQLAEETQDSLLTTVSLGELLHQQGKSMMVFSSGSTGQAYLQHHKVLDGAIVNPDLILPASFKAELYQTIGEPKNTGNSDGGKHAWIVDAFCEYILERDSAEVATLWFSDPDATAHEHGMGAPETKQALQVVDEQFGRVLSAIKEKGLADAFNIIITTDHGFVTHQGEQSLTDFLIDTGLKASESSTDVIVAGGAVVVKDHNPQKIEQIVSSLQAEEWVGAIFTKAKGENSSEGWVSGTLSFASIFWDHPQRAADILVDVNWSRQTNAEGYAGASQARGVAGHGSSSPYEIHIPLIMAGPAFKERVEGELPSSNIDIAPTILHLQNMDIPASIEGRVLHEYLQESSPDLSEKAATQTATANVQYPWGVYELTLHRSVVAGKMYLDYTEVKRKYHEK